MMRSRVATVLFVLCLSTFLGGLMGVGMTAQAAEGRSYLPYWGENGMQSAETPSQVAVVLKTAAMLTFLTLAPSFLILTTCFTRIIIVLSFLRRALATQTLPPDQVLVGLALFLTMFIMAPTWRVAWDDGVRPFMDGEINQATGRALSQEEAFERVLAPTRMFMFACMENNGAKEELEFFMGVSGNEVLLQEDFTRDKVPTVVLIPAFITAELKRAFWMGFLLYLPFLILDVVVASVLMSMGMMMLPPVMISLPFKIVLFVLVDGWRLLMEGLVTSFPVDMIPVLQSVP